MSTYFVRTKYRRVSWCYADTPSLPKSEGSAYCCSLGDTRIGWVVGIIALLVVPRAPETRSNPVGVACNKEARQQNLAPSTRLPHLNKINPTFADLTFVGLTYISLTPNLPSRVRLALVLAVSSTRLARPDEGRRSRRGVSALRRMASVLRSRACTRAWARSPGTQPSMN